MLFFSFASVQTFAQGKDVNEKKKYGTIAGDVTAGESIHGFYVALYNAHIRIETATDTIESVLPTGRFL